MARPPGLQIPHRVRVHPDDAGQIHLPPAPLAVVLPEPVGESLAKGSGDGQGEFYQLWGFFGLLRNLDCTGTRVIRD